MIKSLLIERFRCFEHLKLDSLTRFNVIVGDNASGKTAILEAIYLASGGSPELTLRTRAWRGLPVNVPTVASHVRELFEDIFFNFNTTKDTSIEFVDSHKSRRRLSIFFQTQQEFSFPFGDETGYDQGVPVVTTPIRFQWSTDSQILHTSEIKTEGGKVSFTGTDDTYPGAFLSLSVQNARENAKQFSVLSKRRESDRVINAVREIFPFIRNLTVEADGPDPALYADVDGVDRKMPLGLLSFGINRYLSILLAIISFPKGIVLIDEIDIGIFHTHLSKVLRSIVKCAQSPGIAAQLFVTTHSKECINALMPIADQYPEHCSLIRLSHNDGRSSAHVFGGSEFTAAIEEGFEIR